MSNAADGGKGKERTEMNKLLDTDTTRSKFPTIPLLLLEPESGTTWGPRKLSNGQDSAGAHIYMWGGIFGLVLVAVTGGPPGEPGIFGGGG